MTGRNGVRQGQRAVLACAVLLAAAAGPAVRAAEDGITLMISPGLTSGEIRLDWTGGTPPFQIYRWTGPSGVVDPAHKIGETSGRAWLDFPPAGAVFFYQVTSPCVPATEVCDGADNDCDGTVDEGCAAPDGSACLDPSECNSGHCQNGFCCAAGDCCASDLDCGAYARAAACDSPSTCQGSRVAGVCDAGFQCVGIALDDDSACAGLKSDTCGPYPSVFCTTAVEQPADQAALCAGACLDDTGCDAAAHCDANLCVPDLGQGGACDEPGDCVLGLACVDGVCCSSVCDGTCAACDLSGSIGTCAFIPDRQDPDAECGGVSCAGYYYGWGGDSCYRKADVGAAQATCGGDGACRTTAEECTAQTSPGPITTTCDSFCQDPNLATCTGTTAGTCTNVDQGYATCGSGVCQVTSPRCVNGAPNACVPNDGAATTETCNDLDDNCDGTVDNGAFSDAYEPNGSCPGPSLPGVGSGQTQSVATLTVYPSGDVDTFRLHASETDSSCACCDFFCTDEDYRLTVTITVPVGAGSYRFCASSVATCGGFTCITVNAGASGSLTYNLDGGCPGNDAYDVYLQVFGASVPGYECRPYTLTYRFDSGICL